MQGLDWMREEETQGSVPEPQVLSYAQFINRQGLLDYRRKRREYERARAGLAPQANEILSRSSWAV
jgi:hypothetical protein